MIIKPVLKWVVAVAFGMAVGVLGLVYFTFGWPGIMLIIAMLLGEKIG